MYIFSQEKIKHEETLKKNSYVGHFHLSVGNVSNVWEAGPFLLPRRCLLGIRSIVITTNYTVLKKRSKPRPTVLENCGIFLAKLDT